MGTGRSTGRSTARELSGWGRYPKVTCEVARPESADAVYAAIDRRGTVPRGLGRSYADQATLEGGRVLDLTGLDRYLAFDPKEGILRCEAGVSLGQIIRDFTPRGFFPRITPGTKHVTIGGCIANDVHGKAHHVDGSFSASVLSFKTLLADGSVVTASREQNAELFWASFGGLGLLGVLLEATIRLRKVETTYFKQEAIVARDLTELLDAIEAKDAEYPYSVAWVDSLATGRSLGRGVLTVGEHAPLESLPRRLKKSPLRVTPPTPLRVPFDLPNFALNPLTLRVLNLAIGQVQAHGSAFAHYEGFFYPLDVAEEWNRGYGPRGFTQYQFVIPLEGGRARIREILERITESGLLPFLNVLKRFGAQKEARAGHLSFPFEGYTFAIDFPIQRGLKELLRELDARVLDAGGRVYLGKDAFLDKSALGPMYPELDAWRQIKAQVDPKGVFTSDLARRVGLTG